MRQLLWLGLHPGPSLSWVHSLQAGACAKILNPNRRAWYDITRGTAPVHTSPVQAAAGAPSAQGQAAAA